MLILKTLALEPMHGYGVGLRIEQISGGVFKVNAGSLLPALSRMERAGNVIGFVSHYCLRSEDLAASARVTTAAPSMIASLITKRPTPERYGKP